MNVSIFLEKFNFDIVLDYPCPLAILMAYGPIILFVIVRNLTIIDTSSVTIYIVKILIVYLSI